MVDDLGDLGCDPPLLPGVITVTNPTSVKRFAGIHVYTLNVLEATEGVLDRLGPGAFRGAPGERAA